MIFVNVRYNVRYFIWWWDDKWCNFKDYGIVFVIVIGKIYLYFVVRNLKILCIKCIVILGYLFLKIIFDIESLLLEMFGDLLRWLEIFEFDK